MYRFHPRTERVRALIADGAIGTPRLVRAAFCFSMAEETMARTDNHRLRQGDGGGALLDVGYRDLTWAFPVILSKAWRLDGLLDLGKGPPLPVEHEVSDAIEQPRASAPASQASRVRTIPASPPSLPPAVATSESNLTLGTMSCTPASNPSSSRNAIPAGLDQAASGASVFVGLATPAVPRLCGVPSSAM